MLGPVRRLLLACAAAFACGCPPVDGPDDGIVCATYATAGLSVDVTNAATSASLCAATVVATDGSYSETLSANACRFLGAWERPASYVVRASAPGFASKTIADVRVEMGSGRCSHVQETSLTISLVPTR